MSKGWVTLAEALKIDPDYPSKRINKEGVNLDPVFDPATGAYTSPFQYTEPRVQLDADGMPAFMRICSGEAPNINAVAWFQNHRGTFVSVTYQVRPFADEAYQVPADPPIVFAQPIMGFRDRIVGKEASEVFETSEAGASREALAEAGVKRVLSIKSMGSHWGNPTGPLVTPSDLLDIEVDPKELDLEPIQETFDPKLLEGRAIPNEYTGPRRYRSKVTDASELILKCEYVHIEDVISHLRSGLVEGFNWRASVAMNTFFVWLAYHPETIAGLVNRANR